MNDKIATVVVGYGLAGRAFHCPLVKPERLAAAWDRRPQSRTPPQAVAECGEDVRGYAHLDAALADPHVQLVVIATPHDTHADLAITTLAAKKHCVVDKVMASPGKRPTR